MNWRNAQGSGTVERCGIDQCLRAEGHRGHHRHPKFPPLPGRCRDCRNAVSYGPSKAGWRPAWRDQDGHRHRCAA